MCALLSSPSSLGTNTELGLPFALCFLLSLFLLVPPLSPLCLLSVSSPSPPCPPSHPHTHPHSSSTRTLTRRPLLTNDPNQSRPQSNSPLIHRNLTVQRWVLHGELHDSYKEFFVGCKSPSVSTLSSASNSNMWLDTYHMRSAMLPTFLSQVSGMDVVYTMPCTLSSLSSLPSHPSPPSLPYFHFLYRLPPLPLYPTSPPSPTFLFCISSFPSLSSPMLLCSYALMLLCS